MCRVLAVAALSARSGVELAAADGLRAVALDLFGDADTQRAAEQWLPIGNAAGMRIDGRRLLAALQSLAQRADVDGWIAGSGFEEQPELFERSAQALPLLGTQPADMRRLRDAREFFARLRELGIAHPPVRFELPHSPQGWLVKDFASSGGWGVRRADGVPPSSATAYWQRERDGRAMSATFVANGSDAALLGFNELLTQPIGARPFVFAGVLGPVAVSAALQREIASAVSEMTRTWSVRGLASIDFMLGDDGRSEVLELNARLPASASLYAQRQPLRLHWQACLHDELPPSDLRPPNDEVRGVRTVFTPRALHLDARAAAILAARPRTHDLPKPGARVAGHGPLCSLSAAGADARAVRAELESGANQLLETMESIA